MLDSILSPDNRPVPDLLSWPHFARYSLAGESLSSPAVSFGSSSQLYLSFLSLVFNDWRLSYRNSSWDLPSTSQLTRLPSPGDPITDSITNACSLGPLKRVCVCACVCLTVWEMHTLYLYVFWERMSVSTVWKHPPFLINNSVYTESVQSLSQKLVSISSVSIPFHFTDYLSVCHAYLFSKMHFPLFCPAKAWPWCITDAQYCPDCKCNVFCIQAMCFQHYYMPVMVKCGLLISPDIPLDEWVTHLS